ncbi:MAG: hypothetical protein M0R46_05715 [Candidatus Muirbacterium halophilum]|nr:hypothetical protein [Candidatus Muirbacterium halophilum]MCK9475393.1 hypothetical protein [Candidatus Muirbacterium halophilum]
MFSGFTKVKLNTSKSEVLIVYPELEGFYNREMIFHYIECIEKELSKKNIIKSNSFYLDLSMEKNNLTPGQNINNEIIIESAKNSNSDFAIVSKISDTRFHRTLKTGIALLEPITANTTIIGNIKLETWLVDISNNSSSTPIIVEKNMKNRFGGLFIEKRFLQRKILRHCIGETIYKMEKKELI